MGYTVFLLLLCYKAEVLRIFPYFFHHSKDFLFSRNRLFSVSIKAIGSLNSVSAMIKCSTPLNACGTYALILFTSSSERNNCVARTEFSQTVKSTSSNCWFLSCTSYILILSYPHNFRFIFSVFIWNIQRIYPRHEKHLVERKYLYLYCSHT